ncbi:MAG: TlyA family rRNA (cytidine-2'-O)-methyltransferase, partial [Rhodobiaceae bacterium]|nr:TlyA family rRNA (cytidine-2'-O)-methyltransferase [Rhodobiaceae bacterium]
MSMRLDEALVARSLSASRSRARDQILRGCVFVDGARETKPARKVIPD